MTTKDQQNPSELNKLIRGDLCFRLKKVSFLIGSFYDKQFKTIGLSYKQFFILLGLFDNEVEQLSITQVAEKLSIERSRISKNICIMTNNGLIKSEIKRVDHRGRFYPSNVCTLTLGGKQAVIIGNALLKEAQIAIRETLSTTIYEGLLLPLRHALVCLDKTPGANHETL